MLSKRLTFLAKLCLRYHQSGIPIYDIGCDHALVGEYLLQHGENLEIIGVDRSRAAIERTEKYFKNKYAYIPSGVTYKNNVLKLIHHDASKFLTKKSLFLLAGMGTRTIISIMENLLSQNTGNIFILSAHTEIDKLKQYLIKSQLEIVEETILEDNGQSYEILIVR